jgi:hypothetical protein
VDQYRDQEEKPEVPVRFVEFHVRFILHQAMGEFIAGHAPAGQKHQYAQDDISEAEDKYYPGRYQRMEKGVHFLPLINLVIAGLLQFNFAGTP